MLKPFLLLTLLSVVLLPSCTPSKSVAQSTVTPQRPIAFPGAEGFGRYATGGRGGKIFIVDNLNDDGSGSFREAATAKGKRIIVFAVSGTIRLKQPVSIRADVTIAGQTAPGDGICIADHPVTLAGDNIIIRYLRFRMGDRYQNAGKKPGSGHDDAFSATRRSQIIIDHCSLSWSTDEVMSVYAGDSTTLQWNLISEPLNYSYHFEEGDTDWENHGYGGIWGGQHLSAHHNLFAHCTNRTPRFNGIRHTPTELVDYRNNVLYNWGGNNIYAGEGGFYNIVNNYYKYGPNTQKNVKYRIVNPGRNENIGFGKWFVNGNHVDGAPEISRNNWNGIQMGNGGTEEDKRNTIISAPHAAEPLPLETAEQAYQAVLSKVGASYKRDTLDVRIIRNVETRTGSIIDVQGGFPHGTAFELTLQAWPQLRSSAPLNDTDRDGIPDEWEKKNGLNEKDASDASACTLHASYTNIEMYINSIAQ